MFIITETKTFVQFIQLWWEVWVGTSVAYQRKEPGLSTFILSRQSLFAQSRHLPVLIIKRGVLSTLIFFFFLFFRLLNEFV